VIVERVTERTYANTTGEGRGNFGAIILARALTLILSSLGIMLEKGLESTYLKPWWRAHLTNVL
jgi:hypothetical protein